MTQSPSPIVDEPGNEDAATLLIYLRGSLSRVRKDGFVEVPRTYLDRAIELLAASPASGERDAWAGSAPFITSESGGGEYVVRVKVHSMDELHAAHTLVLKAFGAKL